MLFNNPKLSQGVNFFLYSCPPAPPGTECTICWCSLNEDTVWAQSQGDQTSETPLQKCRSCALRFSLFVLMLVFSESTNSFVRTATWVPYCNVRTPYIVRTICYQTQAMGIQFLLELQMWSKSRARLEWLGSYCSLSTLIKARQPDWLTQS